MMVFFFAFPQAFDKVPHSLTTDLLFPKNVVFVARPVIATGITADFIKGH